MKNCHFPLDIVHLTKDGTVVDVLANVPPCAADPCPTYPPAAAVGHRPRAERGGRGEERARPRSEGPVRRGAGAVERLEIDLPIVGECAR